MKIPEIDPIIGGLLKRLPETGDVWAEADRKLWLRLLAGSFKLIYKDAPMRSFDQDMMGMAATTTAIKKTFQIVKVLLPLLFLTKYALQRGQSFIANGLGRSQI